MSSIDTISLDALLKNPTGANIPVTHFQVAVPENLAMARGSAARIAVQTGCDHIQLEVLLVRRGGRKLVVSLHGALDRQRYALPRFERLSSLLAFDADLLLVSDPTLRLDDDLQLAWYTGWTGYDASDHIAQIITHVARQWEIASSEVTVTGSSGGGYSALRIGKRVPGSTIVAFNAQTAIWNYLAAGTSYSSQRALIRAAYSEDVIEVDDDHLSVADWTRAHALLSSPRSEFSSEQDNWIHLVQNVDEFHYADHYVPFIREAVMGGNGSRLVLHEYHGGSVHVPPTPQIFAKALQRVLVKDRSNVPATPEESGANGPFDRPLHHLVDRLPRPSRPDAKGPVEAAERILEPGQPGAEPTPADHSLGSEVTAAVEDRLDSLEGELARVKSALGVRGDDSDSRHVTTGRGTNIDPSVSLHARYTANAISIGEHVRVFRGGEWLGPVTVGDRVFINRDSYIRPGVTIDNDVSLGPFVSLITDTHEESTRIRRTGQPVKHPIHIGQGTWIGAHATVLAGVTIGRRVIVAAGAVVVNDVPDNTLVAGVPARVIKELPPLSDI